MRRIMNIMALSLLPAMTFHGLPASAADMEAEVRQALVAWQPTEVVRTDSVLTVVLPQRSITQKIYTASMAWLCVNSSVGQVDLEDINEIRIPQYVRPSGDGV